ncbi:MAG: glutamate 5-kinase [Brevibacterium sp.]|uniref:glutamate 5-kinase n=1 Tax=Brevibacterium sp. TaxID=1701 RepID=UPI0026481536|nr:glutamate 5-kinase [Brevibacterium sp.]MDN5807167.1 glutamate 5-kinase [Brevibacterium sp.]MDN5833566.1 glutamate 5-kinase [Brevibacterium sp.]MDN5877421.1 glutamate 5-kinase [Brevibacterium sp.]MDN5909023.1 glutamate 5-kinase [Brevibacterium sp.]MDN6134303.1 glutamate 5-kinase [Brevibacterium sp.]
MSESHSSDSDTISVRTDIAAARRIVIKVGSSSLTTLDGGLDEAKLIALTDVIGARRAAGHEVILVSSGAIAAGLEPMGLNKRPRDLATQQAAAGVGQGLLMAAYTRALGRYDLVPGQVLLSADDLIRRTRYKNAQRAIDKLLALGTMPIVNENDAVATEEIRFGDNDRLAALVAHLSHADALVLLSDVDALYSGPPNMPDSVLIEQVSSIADLGDIAIGGTGDAGTGTGGMATKVEAALMVADSGIPAVLTSAERVASVLAGEHVGTWFSVTHKRRGTRLLWLRHLARTFGSVTIDNGAESAVLSRGTSLLAAGVTGVTGDFEAGDPIEIRNLHGEVIARGMTNFSSYELPAMFGYSTDELGTRLGNDYRKEVIHRNDLVLTHVSGGR